MDESFDIGDAEPMQIEEIAKVANLDEITLCYCRGMCLWEKGRNACPCKTIGQYCSSACHDLSSACMNRLQYIESDFDSSKQPTVRNIPLRAFSKISQNFVEYLFIFDIFGTTKVSLKVKSSSYHAL